MADQNKAVFTSCQNWTQCSINGRGREHCKFWKSKTENVETCLFYNKNLMLHCENWKAQFEALDAAKK
jgi:hypothetical protein